MFTYDRQMQLHISAHPGTSELSDQAVSSEQKFYDDVYFDSDEEEMVLQGLV